MLKRDLEDRIFKMLFLQSTSLVQPLVMRNSDSVILTVMTGTNWMKGALDMDQKLVVQTMMITNMRYNMSFASVNCREYSIRNPESNFFHHRCAAYDPNLIIYATNITKPLQNSQFEAQQHSEEGPYFGEEELLKFIQMPLLDEPGKSIYT